MKITTNGFTGKKWIAHLDRKTQVIVQRAWIVGLLESKKNAEKEYKAIPPMKKQMLSSFFGYTSSAKYLLD